MPKVVNIDLKSGFCGGVIRAIKRAENFVEKREGTDKLYSLGSIVHNEAELERLEKKGLVTIGKEEFSSMKGENVLIRAHGEPPETYVKAKKLGLNLIDCTCPVVLRLQQRIKEAYENLEAAQGKSQILIFGKKGHAEVLGLMGQIAGDALVIPNKETLLREIEEGNVKVKLKIAIFSQTTKSPDEYQEICGILQEKMAEARFLCLEDFLVTKDLQIHDTICSQVSSRHDELKAFAKNHDVIIFVAGKESSNGKVLYELCLGVNPRSYHISKSDDIEPQWYGDEDSVGICGATSTPKWLLEEVASKILKG